MSFAHLLVVGVIIFILYKFFAAVRRGLSR